MNDATETITDHATEAADLIQATEESVKAAQQYHDGDLTPEAMERKRDELIKTARADGAKTLAGIHDRVNTESVLASRKHEKNRPRIDDKDAAALVRAEQRWNYDVRPVLDAGMPLKEFLRTADLEDVLAAERFGRGYLRAAQASGDNPLELTADDLPAAVANRIAAALPDGEREGFEDGVRAAHAADTFREIHSLASEAIAGKHWNATSAYARSKTLAINLKG